MIDSSILEQVKTLFQDLTTPLTLQCSIGSEHPEAASLREFLNDFVSTSPLLELHEETAQGNTLSFELVKDGQPTGISFRGIPNGHEFTSLLMAVFNANGLGKNLPDEGIRRRIAALRGPAKITTYVSLTCTNCPDVVQALNVMALINPQISHEMVDGALFQEEVNALNIQGVPAVFIGKEQIHSGKSSLAELLDTLEEKLGTTLSDDNAQAVERQFDVVVLGGGPAGVSAAIYSARKGLSVAIVAERIGGQVKDTVGIENLISVPKTTGAQLADDLQKHAAQYPIEVFENRKVTAVSLTDKVKKVQAKGGETFLAPALILATGANWRRLNVPGEKEMIGRGVHFCPHCDGPFYKDKTVAVIGGGNSGIEAAIDLAGICKQVTVVEFGDKLIADNVLQEKLRSLPNTEVITRAQTTSILNNGSTVTGLQIKNRDDDSLREISLDGVFVQIGLAPGSELFAEQLELSPRKEVKIDETNRTSIPGVYAAGDVSTVPYKQIIIAMGEGAKAALSAFDDRVRGII